MKTFLCALCVLCGALFSGCATVNFGTVNQITVIKSNHGGNMTSATEASEANPASTTLDIPLAKGTL